MGSKSKECTRTIHRVEVSDVADEDAASDVYRSCFVLSCGTSWLLVRKMKHFLEGIKERLVAVTLG